MILSDAEFKELQAGAPRIGYFFRLDTDPVVPIWMGIGRVKPGVDSIDPETGRTYYGFGEIVDVPSFRQLINGQAERISFNLSGVSEEIVKLATEEDAPAIKGADTALGFALMGEDWQPLGSIKWIRRYTADVLKAGQAVSEDPGAHQVRTISLSVGSLMTGRRRPGLSYFTDFDQQRRSPGDKFCERTTLYSQETTKAWPRFQ